MVLEGKEFETKVGEVGTAFIDVDAKGAVVAGADVMVEGIKAKLTIEGDIVALLEMLAMKTENKIDDKMIATIKAALGR